jgi:hypothetical protein
MKRRVAMSKYRYEVGVGLNIEHGECDACDLIDQCEEFSVTIGSFPNLKDAKKYGEKFYFLQTHEQWDAITDATGVQEVPHSSGWEKVAFKRKVEHIFIDRWFEDDPDGRTIDESWGSMCYTTTYRPIITWTDARLPQPTGPIITWTDASTSRPIIAWKDVSTSIPRQS